MLSKNKIKFIRSLGQKKIRKQEGLFVAEGDKLVSDLLPCFECRLLVATSDWLAQSVCVSDLRGIEIIEVDYDELCKASFLETPQHVLAVFCQKEYNVDKSVISKSLCLGLDDVQNPGNLGTIIRLADWFGIEDVFCSIGCADIYNPKTVQATMGGLAHVRVHYVDLCELLDSLNPDTPVYGTFLDGENIYEKSLSDKGLLLMGNEGRGVSEKVGERVTERLYVPNYPAGRPTSESLNVAIATAVVCSEFRRQNSTVVAGKRS